MALHPQYEFDVRIVISSATTTCCVLLLTQRRTVWVLTIWGGGLHMLWNTSNNIQGLTFLSRMYFDINHDCYLSE